MIIYIDIDDTICTLQEPMNYQSARPIPLAIQRVNDLYDSGHTIVFWTARGTLSGIDWRELTESQLNDWGIKYHELKLGKPAYDIFIDDKNINSKDWLNLDIKY
jgi:hypothetical protein